MLLKALTNCLTGGKYVKSPVRLSFADFVEVSVGVESSPKIKYQNFTQKYRVCNLLVFTNVSKLRNKS